jgi:ribosomal protein L11 methyltransferase
MLTYSAIAQIADPDAAERLAADCEELWPEPTGVGTFEIEDGSGLFEVAAYFTESPDQAGLALLATIHGARPFVVSEVPDQDWVSKVRRDLSPVEAGRFFVYGSHDADKVPEGRIPLLIEAAMAFGTGHHGTTLGCLRALDRLIEAGEVKHRVADIGCGTAVLAMAAARVWPETVLASDIDGVAVAVAEANVKVNGLNDRVICIEAPGFDAAALHDAAPFDLVFANILKGPLVMIAPDMAKHVGAGGHVILSGILNEQADDVIAVYSRNGFNLVDRTSIVDWTTLTMWRES